jgi:hypothetical protein
LWVVLEPASADTVFTETLDDSFWNWLARTYPPAPGKVSSGGRGTVTRTDTQSTSKTQSASKHEGMVFLVDPRTRVVLWSAYQLPAKSSSSELNHSATRIVNELKSSFGKQ